MAFSMTFLMQKMYENRYLPTLDSELNAYIGGVLSSQRNIEVKFLVGQNVQHFHGNAG